MLAFLLGGIANVADAQAKKKRTVTKRTTTRKTTKTKTKANYSANRCCCRYCGCCCSVQLLQVDSLPIR